MTKVKKGLLGALSGKIGPVVGASWKGIPYIRTKPKSAPVQTSARRMAQYKFGFLTSFLKPFHPYLMQGFKIEAVGKTEFNVAFTENFNTALKGDYPDFEIDFSLLCLSKGKLAGVENPVCTRLSASQLELTWEDISRGKFHYNDQIMVVIYSPEQKRADGVVGIAKRNMRKCLFNIGQRLWEADLEVYLSVIANNGKAVSNSVYLGRMVAL